VKEELSSALLTRVLHYAIERYRLRYDELPGPELPSDAHLHLLLNGQLTPADALAPGSVTVAGDAAALTQLLELVAFPATV